MRLSVSVTLRGNDDIKTLTDQILAAAAVPCDGSGAGFGYRDTEYEVETADDGKAAGERIAAAFPDREVIWDVQEGDEILASGPRG
jgi:hypothetical protein